MYWSSLSSTRGRLSRQQENNKLVWWGKQQKPTSSLMADVAASAGDEKKGFFDKVRLRLDSTIGSSIERQRQIFEEGKNCCSNI